MKKERAALLQMLLCTLLWSTSGLLVKLVPWNALVIAGCRSILTGIVMGLYMRARRMRLVRSRQSFAIAVALMATYITYLPAIKLTTAANAIVLQYIAPILILLYTTVVQKRRPTAVEIALTAVVFVGCVLAFCDKLGGSGTLGDVLAIISGFTFAALILINGMEKTQPEDGQIIGCGLSFICCLPFVFTDSHFIITWESVGAMLALGLVQYSLANILFGKGIKKTEPTAASVILTMEPIMNPVWVFLMLGEAPGPLALTGFVLVVAAVTLQSLIPNLRRRKRPGDVQSAAAEQ